MSGNEQLDPSKLDMTQFAPQGDEAGLDPSIDAIVNDPDGVGPNVNKLLGNLNK